MVKKIVPVPLASRPLFVPFAASKRHKLQNQFEAALRSLFKSQEIEQKLLEVKHLKEQQQLVDAHDKRVAALEK